MTTTLPGAVFDCVVFLQAAISRKGPSFACKELLDADRVAVFLSPEVLAEVTDVLNRPELQKKFKSLTPEKAGAFLQDLAHKAIALAEVPKQFTYARDPNDEPYVNLALAAGARYLVTFDKDLLDLMNEAIPEGRAFRQRFPGLTILTPAAFLREFSPKEDEPPVTGQTTNEPPPAVAP